MQSGEVRIGWQLWYDGKVRTVTGKKYGPPFGDEIDRRCRLYFDDGSTAWGDEGQTVYRVTEEADPTGTPGPVGEG
jgi:hypothetical protein